MFLKHPSGQDAHNCREILEDVIKHKKVFFSTSFANYDDCPKGSLILLPEDETLKQLQSDYEKMLASGMIYQDSPSFTEFVESIPSIEHKINSWYHEL